LTNHSVAETKKAGTITEVTLVLRLAAAGDETAHITL
jgi:hypothetical protein